VAAGIYFVHLRFEQEQRVRKIVRLGD
jgi:hypothetical protein